MRCSASARSRSGSRAARGATRTRGPPTPMKSSSNHPISSNTSRRIPRLPPRDHREQRRTRCGARSVSRRPRVSTSHGGLSRSDVERPGDDPVLAQRLAHGPHPPRLDHVVAVADRDAVRRRRLHAGLAGVAEPGPVGRVDHADACVTRCVLLRRSLPSRRSSGCRRRRPPTRRPRLAEQRVELLGKRVRDVVRGDDDGLRSTAAKDTAGAGASWPPVACARVTGAG